ncbi:MAG: ATP-binding protein, partial [Myxococcales bacterium]|nr:ATP-binding protein [Myxococcales bacterium]
ESIGLRDFRGIRLGKVEGLTSLNVLIGPNNSGKTALLEAMYLGCAVGVRAAIGSRLVERNPIVQLASSDLLGDHPMARVWTKHLHPAQRAGLGQWIPPNPQIGPIKLLSVSIRRAGAAKTSILLSPHDLADSWPEEFELQTAFLGADDAEKGKSWALPAQWLSSLLPPPEPPKRTVYFWDKPLTYRSRGDAAWYLTGKLPTAAHTFFYDAQKTLQHLPTEFYNRMLDAGVKGWQQKIAERVGRVLGIAEPFQIMFMPTGPQHEWMQGRIAPADSPSLSIDDFGDGARAAFKVLAPLIALSELVTDDEPGVFFWEEPELFQNPLTLGRLLTEVADLLQKKPLQVFLATHSMEVVAKLVGLVRTGQLPEDKLRTLRTFLHQGEFSATPFSTEDLERLSNMGFDPRVPDGDAGSPLRFRLAPDPEAPPLAEAGDE